MRSRMLLLRLAVTVCAAMSSAASPASEKGAFSVYGAGASNCASWLLERRKILVDGTPSVLGWEQMGWVLGYMTAYSQHRPATPGDAPLPNGLAVASALDAYCAEHPREFLFAAISAIVQDAAQQSIEARPIRAE